MFPKIFQYDGHFEHTGEPRLQILDRRDIRLYKHASEDARGYLSQIKPEPGKTTLLVLAMSSGEHYGPNRNGDAFSEKPVKVNNEWAVAPGEELPLHHQTFEDGHVFRHHINKDPAKSFGEVIKSFYNDVMHRVELLLSIDNEKGRDVVQRVDGGEFPGVSMGCKIDYDVCDICGNRAPTRNEYCEHVSGKDPRYGMNRLLEDGRRCFVWNPSPRFFDLSFVFKPADRIGYMMKKVADSRPYDVKLSADLGADVSRLNEKAALLGKISDIDKIIKGVAGKPEDIGGMSPSELEATKRLYENVVKSATAAMADIDVPTLAKIARAPFPVVLSTMNALGMVPSTKEAFTLICLSRGVNPPLEMIHAVGAAQGKVAAELRHAPQLLDHIEHAGLLKVSADLVDAQVAEILAPWREKRGLYREYLARKHIPESMGPLLSGPMGYDADDAYYGSAMGNLHFQDPSTGRVYQTTQNAAERADWENKKKELIEAAGLAGLLGAGVKTLTASPKWKWLAAPAWAGAGLMGNRIYNRQKMPQVATLEGTMVPANTEFVEKRGSMADVLAPIGGGALLTFLLAQDYRQDPRGQGLPYHAWANPVPTGLGLTALGAGGLALGKGLTSFMKQGFTNPAYPEELDLSDAVWSLGEMAVGHLIHGSMK